MEVDFAGGAYKTFSNTLNAQECVNFFSHLDQEGGTSKLSLRGTPGLKNWCDTGELSRIRGMLVMGESLFAVVGRKLFLIDAAGVATAASVVLNTFVGTVSMATNGTQLMIVDGTNGYVVTQAAGVPTLVAISDPGFPANPMTVTQQDGYFIVTIANSGRAYISALKDATSWEDTSFFNAEGDSDYTLAVISDHRDLMMFGAASIEAWYNSAESVPFSRKPGFFQEVGLGARFSLAKLDSAIFFLTDEFQVVRISGGAPAAVSTRSIDHQIAQYSDKSDAIGMVANIEGNSFYILTFPTAGVTWVYNAATTLWHQLASYPEPFTGRWRGNCTAYFNGKTYVGDYENGKIYELDFATYTDNLQPIRRTRVSNTVRKENKLLGFSKLEMMFEPGVGLDAGVQGADPMVALQYSNDGGFTYSSEIWRSVGRIGKYKWRAYWNRLGSARQRVFKVTVSDPVKWVITGAELEVTGATS